MLINLEDKIKYLKNPVIFFVLHTPINSVIKTNFTTFLQLDGFTHDEEAHQKHHYEKYPHEEAI